jgi:hypothetical protein
VLIGRGKIVIFCLLVVVGAILLIYGIWFHRADIAPKQADHTPKLAKSEPALMREVSVGGVKRDASGELKRTYTETEKAPAACPT